MGLAFEEYFWTRLYDKVIVVETKCLKNHLGVSPTVLIRREVMICSQGQSINFGQIKKRNEKMERLIRKHVE